MQLPKFCEAEKVRTHPAFTQSDGNDDAEKLVPPTNFKVTHVRLASAILFTL